MRTLVAIATMVLALSQGINQKTFLVSVHDKNGRPVQDLTKDSFQVFEDKVKQEIVVFKHEDSPASVGLVIDDSGSMRGDKQKRVNDAVLMLMTESNPENETFLVSFGDSATLEHGFTRSVGNIMDALSQLRSRGQTALFDAVQLAVDKMKDGRNAAKALVLVSDGEDNGSRSKYEDVIKRLKESDVTVYPIVIATKPSSKARQLLQGFADITGGTAYFPKSLDDLDAISKDLGREIRSRYLIGYEPINKSRDNVWREVRITAPAKAGFIVRAKSGYSATR